MARPWMQGARVVGAGVTQKIVAGARIPAQAALTIYVTEKLAVSSLPSSSVVPTSVSVPGVGEDIVTDVVAIGKLSAQSNTAGTRPLLPGYSVGLLSGDETGTAGWFVASADDPNTPLILSNSHVIADTGLSAVGTSIVQPGRKDGGGRSEIVGALLRSVEFDFGAGYMNFCDAAVATLSEGVEVSTSIPTIGTPTYDPNLSITVGMTVQKTGRTTGYTTGVVQDVHFRTLMLYPKPSGGYGNAGFRDQVLCTRYSDGGDSGSVVCDMDGHAVGLHWAGSNAASIFSPLQFVFQALGLVPLQIAKDRVANSDLSLRALDQYASTLSKLSGVQGVGLDVPDGLAVYVAQINAQTKKIPKTVIISDDAGSEVAVPIRVKVIGPISPE